MLITCSKASTGSASPGSPVGHRPDHDGDEGDVLHRQVGAYLTGALGAGEELAHDGGDPAARLARPRVGRGQRRFRQLADPLDLVLKERQQQVRLAREAPVHGTHADAGGPGDVVVTGGQARLGEQLSRRGEDPPAVVLGLASPLNMPSKYCIPCQTG